MIRLSLVAESAMIFLEKDLAPLLCSLQGDSHLML